MSKVVEEIQKLAAQYYSQDELTAYIAEINRLSANTTNEFYQLLQQDTEIVVEYAAIANGVIVDIVLSPRSIRTTVVDPRSVSSIVDEFETKPASGYTVHVLCRGYVELKYVASSKDPVLRLRNYTIALQQLIMRRQ
jgi:hypothetical protein